MELAGFSKDFVVKRFFHSIVGTPEIGGLTTIQALEIVRGLRGLNIVGGDLVEVRN